MKIYLTTADFCGSEFLQINGGGGEGGRRLFSINRYDIAVNQTIFFNITIL